MTPDTILTIAKLQGVSITPERAKELAEAVTATLAIANQATVPFEAEPDLYRHALDATAAR
jgi:hypothetical protein